MNPIRIIQNWLGRLITFQRQLKDVLDDKEFGELSGLAHRLDNDVRVCWTAGKRVAYGRYNDVVLQFHSDMTGPKPHQRTVWHQLLLQAEQLLEKMEEPLRSTYEEIRVEWSLDECPTVSQAEGIRQLVRLDAIEIGEAETSTHVGFLFTVKWDADHDLMVHVVDGRIHSVGVEG